MKYDLPHGKVTAHDRGGCWVCGVKNVSFNAHHIIPRNAGGTNGPQVQICSECHDGLHHAAHLVISADDYALRPDAKQKWVSMESRQRAEFLIQLVRRSQEVASRSENKTTKVTLTLTGEQDRKLTYLSRRLGMSKADTIAHLIENGVVAHKR